MIKNSKGYLGNQDAFYHSLAKTHMDDEQDKAQEYLTKLQKDFGYKNPKTKLVADYFLEKELPIGY